MAHKILVNSPEASGLSIWPGIMSILPTTLHFRKNIEFQGWVAPGFTKPLQSSRYSQFADIIQRAYCRTAAGFLHDTDIVADAAMTKKIARSTNWFNRKCIGKISLSCQKK